MIRILLHIILFISTVELLNAQDTSFTLAGKIIDCQTHKSIEGVKLRLICSDGRCLETLSDGQGNYFFDNSIIKKNRQYVISTQTEMDLGYLNSSEKYKFGVFDSTLIKNIKRDFCLSKNEGCILRLPVLHYEENSITNFTYDLDVVDLDFLKEFMLDNPTLVIEIGAHTSADERKPTTLSTKRLDHLKNILIQKGIPSDRLVLRVYGNEKPNVSSEEIDKLRTSEEKEVAYKKNRRVVFNIVRKDYIPTKPN